MTNKRTLGTNHEILELLLNSSLGFLYLPELREKLSFLGANLKQNLVASMRTTWNTLHDFARAHTVTGTLEAPGQDESEADGVEREVAEEPGVGEFHALVEWLSRYGALMIAIPY